MLQSITLPHPRWYAAHTSAHHEKRVAEQLAARALECFLPLYNSRRRWQDRHVHLQLPLFPGYIFVHIPLGERMRVLQVPSVVHLVSVRGQPVPIPDQDVERLRTGLSASLCAKPHPFLIVGRRARIVRGPLEGLEGVFVRKKGLARVVVSVEMIQRSMSVDLEMDCIEPIRSGPSHVPLEPRSFSGRVD